jgi:hypothetical protein
VWSRPEGRVRRIRAAGPRLVADAEAFLNGNYLDHLRGQGDGASGWAWLNRLAHGDLESIARVPGSIISHIAQLGEWTNDEWLTAEQIIVSEVLDLVSGDASALARLQKGVLVPLELRLIQVDLSRGLTPIELVQSTRAALHSSIA